MNEKKANDYLNQIKKIKTQISKELIKIDTIKQLNVSQVEKLNSSSQIIKSFHSDLKSIMNPWFSYINKRKKELLNLMKGYFSLEDLKELKKIKKTFKRLNRKILENQRKIKKNKKSTYNLKREQNIEMYINQKNDKLKKFISISEFTKNRGMSVEYVQYFIDELYTLKYKEDVTSLNNEYLSLNQLGEDLLNEKFLFPTNPTYENLDYSYKKVVGDPSVVQLLDKGFFSPEKEDFTSKRNGGSFSILFMNLMAQHGFDQGINWGGAKDAMHLELVEGVNSIKTGNIPQISKKG